MTMQIENLRVVQEFLTGENMDSEWSETVQAENVCQTSWRKAYTAKKNGGISQTEFCTERKLIKRKQE